MDQSGDKISIPEEVVMNKIYIIRNVKVMIDRDLADLYDVETKVLKQSVKRHLKRFPCDFMFQMSESEFEAWRNEYANIGADKKGLRYAPFCFTEQGVAMLSSILNSDRAIQVNIQIIRVFTKMRNLLATHTEILKKLELLKKKDTEQDEKIMLIFDYIEELENKQKKETEQIRRKKIGFKTKKNQ
ncbi:MAG: ORF6N domain-containing protein [Bacteroidales bacterium]|nr:ORF6N domain-containing protein [Bacteroidales bacterium]MCF8333858.1 ORF6N domain-containing protein [Bacteroidales bacterium]